jgi:hypothetical protein
MKFSAVFILAPTSVFLLLQRSVWAKFDKYIRERGSSFKAFKFKLAFQLAIVAFVKPGAAMKM